MFNQWKEYLMTGRRAGAALHKANPKMVAGFQALGAGAAYGSRCAHWRRSSSSGKKGTE